jgi:hypothetical protein
MPTCGKTRETQAGGKDLKGTELPYGGPDRAG